MIEKTRLKPELAASIRQWDYIGCHTSVKIGGGGGVSISRECEACGNTNLRFIHTLEHLEDQRQIWVGIECARALLGPEEWEIPGLAENEVKRKERWRIHYRKPGRCTADISDLERRGVL